METDAIKCLLDRNHIVICGGGGGAPVVKNGPDIEGFEAVIDKDATAPMLAQEIGAAELLILTDGAHVCVDWGKPSERPLTDVTVAEMRGYAFAAGSMGPKVDACCAFAEKTGGVGNIGDLYHALDVMNRTTGTRIHR